MTEPAAAPAPTPSGLESIWLVEATYAPDAAETRTPFRAEHLAGVRSRLADGTYVEAGAYADVSASVILVRAGSAEAAVRIVSDDVYLRNGVWVEVRAKAFGRVVPADPAGGG